MVMDPGNGSKLKGFFGLLQKYPALCASSLLPQTDRALLVDGYVARLPAIALVFGGRQAMERIRFDVDYLWRSGAPKLETRGCDLSACPP
jgi:hypothetical protein